jgi:hypothetical protein
MNTLWRGLRLLPIPAAALTIAACGGAMLIAGAPVAHLPAHSPHATMTATASPPPALAPTPEPAQPPAGTTFAIEPLFAGGAAGSVTALPTASGVRLHVVVTRLVPGSVHAIHDHRGACSPASRSAHLSVLGVLRADASGTIVFDTTVTFFQYGAGRIVIVYDSATPAIITGCASI